MIRPGRVWNGPDINSQNGSNSRKAARSGMKVVRGGIMHVGCHPDCIGISPAALYAREYRQSRALGPAAARRRYWQICRSVAVLFSSTWAMGSGFAMIFQSALDCDRAAFNQSIWYRPSNAVSPLELFLSIAVVPASIAPRIQNKNIDVLTVGHFAK